MFNISILDTIYIATTVMAAIMTVICLNEMFSQIDKSFMKLKEERKSLEIKVQTLEKELDELKVCDEEVEPRFHSDGRPTSSEINSVLVSENRKLLVRCDMLEEELCKMREQNDINNRYSFRVFSDKTN
jgi:hypothetical protein